MTAATHSAREGVHTTRPPPPAAALNASPNASRRPNVANAREPRGLVARNERRTFRRLHALVPRRQEERGRLRPAIEASRARAAPPRPSGSRNGCSDGTGGDDPRICCALQHDERVAHLVEAAPRGAPRTPLGGREEVKSGFCVTGCPATSATTVSAAAQTSYESRTKTLSSCPSAGRADPFALLNFWGATSRSRRSALARRRRAPPHICSAREAAEKPCPHVR